MSIPTNLNDRELAKFSEVGTGTVAVNVNSVGGASGYAEGTTVGTVTGNAIVFRGTGGTTTAVGTANPLPVQEEYAAGAEDNTVGVFKVEQRFSYTNMVAAATTILKGTATGLLHTVVINTPIASDVITLFDSASGTASTIIGKIALPGTLLTNGPITATYNTGFVNGLVVAHTGTSDLTINWR